MFEKLVILPLSAFVGLLFSLAFSLTGDYGLSLVLLSLMVSLVVYPLQVASDRLKARDDAEKAAFAPVLEAIRSRYAGAERYYYTRYLNRLHGYHPIKAMRSLGGLAVQIPFFLGAYHFLGHYGAFSGRAFAFLGDLGRPDGLLGGLNLLPFAMTAVNMLASEILLSGKPAKERLQLHGMALLFLVLLYGSPSALVLYWTCNNLFSLLKVSAKKLLKGERLLELGALRSYLRPSLLLQLAGLAAFGFLATVPKGRPAVRYAGIAGLACVAACAVARFARAYRRERHFRALAVLLALCAAALPAAWIAHRVLGLARHSETLEPLVVYQALYGERGLWTRPQPMFVETVTHARKTVTRFRFIGDT